MLKIPCHLELLLMKTAPQKLSDDQGCGLTLNLYDVLDVLKNIIRILICKKVSFWYLRDHVNLWYFRSFQYTGFFLLFFL